MQDVDAMVCRMSETPLHPNQNVAVKHLTKHTTRSVRL
jgi:sulfate adenylyltransferase subunit 1 (EFTu-like GTPase family)